LADGPHGIGATTFVHLLRVGGKGNGSDDSDDRDHDHQLDQRKTLCALTVHNRFSPDPEAILAPAVVLIGRIRIVHPAFPAVHPPELAGMVSGA
jgi:hypothetical protein